MKVELSLDEIKFIAHLLENYKPQRSYFPKPPIPGSYGFGNKIRNIIAAASVAEGNKYLKP